MNENKEIVTHTVVIDEFLELKWKIPLVISAIQLKAMSYKIDKLFKISETPISDEEVEATKEPEKVVRVARQKKSTWKKNQRMPKEMVERLTKLRDEGKTTRQISDELGIPLKTCKYKINNLRYPSQIYQHKSDEKSDSENISQEEPKGVEANVSQ